MSQENPWLENSSIYDYSLYTWWDVPLYSTFYKNDPLIFHLKIPNDCPKLLYFCENIKSFYEEVALSFQETLRENEVIAYNLNKLLFNMKQTTESVAQKL